MIYLVDYVLPESYFARNLQALSVDVVVFRDLLALCQPSLAAHLQKLQKEASNYPLDNRKLTYFHSQSFHFVIKLCYYQMCLSIIRIKFT